MVGENRLSAIFDRADESTWRSLVERTLRGSSLDSRVRRSDDGLAMGPIYSAPEKLADLSGRPLNAPWTVVQRSDDPDPAGAGEALAADLDGGANGIELVFAQSASARRTGFGLPSFEPGLIDTISSKENLHLRIDAGEASYKYAADLANLETIDLTVAYDQLAHGAARGGFDQPLADIEQEIVAAAVDINDSGRRGAALIADGRPWAAGGASEAQELAGILGSLVHNARLLIDAGLAPEQALRAISITVECGSNQLLAIAKIRALRLVHARIVEAFGAAPMQAHIHAETSWRMMTRYGVHTNILRTTSAAFAAGIGGADSITVLPFTTTLGLPDNLARRIARNSQIVLIEEAGLGRVSDPAAGSGAVETLTEAIAQAAWEKFRALEAEGGLLDAIRSGTFQKDVANMREVRAQKVARREIVITGISEYPNLEEAETSVVQPRPPASIPSPAKAESFERVIESRLAEPFEDLRDRAAKLAANGAAPKVFLAKLGAPEELSDAEQAAAGFFAAGGIDALAGEPDTPENLSEAFAKSGACTACIIGTQERLDELAAPTASAIRSRGAARIYLYGRAVPGADTDDALGDNSNILKVLGEILDRAQ